MFLDFFMNFLIGNSNIVYVVILVNYFYLIMILWLLVNLFIYMSNSMLRYDVCYLEKRLKCSG